MASVKRGGMDMALSAVRILGPDGRWLSTDEIVDEIGGRHPELHRGWDDPNVAVYSALYRLNKRGDVEKRIANLNGADRAFWRLPQAGGMDVEPTVRKRGYRAGGRRVSEDIGYEVPSDSEKAALFSAQGGVCYLCGLAMREALDAEIDHIVARSKGGDISIDGGNIALADPACNRIKGNRELSEARILIADKLTQVDMGAAKQAEYAAKRWAANIG